MSSPLPNPIAPSLQLPGAPAAAAALAVSPCGTHLLCGLEHPDDSGVALLDVDPENGSVVRSLPLPGSGGVRSLRWTDASSLLCLRTDGTFAALNAAGEVQSTWFLGTHRQPTPKTSSKSAVKPPPSPPPTPAPEGPEFVRAQGYRGPKPGYLYREGDLGSGYYRNDVVRQHTGAAPLETVVAAAAPAAAQARGLRCCAAPASLKWAATASDDPDDGTVTVWRLGPEGGAATQHKTLRGHSAGVLCLAISPDDAFLFSGSYDQTVRVWDTATWTCVRVLKGHGGGVRAAAPSSDGALLYTAAADNTVRAWAVGAWVCLRLMHGRHEDTTWPACMDLSSSGSEDGGSGVALLVTGSTGPFGASTLKAFDPTTCACLATFAQLGYDQRGGQTAVAVAPSGTRAYSAASDGTVAAWKLIKDDGSNAKPGIKCGFFS